MTYAYLFKKTKNSLKTISNYFPVFNTSASIEILHKLNFAFTLISLALNVS